MIIPFFHYVINNNSYNIYVSRFYFWNEILERNFITAELKYTVLKYSGMLTNLTGEGLA